MARHIGIVGVSPEGAALFYRLLSRQLAERLGQESDPQYHPRVTLHSKPIRLYLNALNKNDWVVVGGLLRRSADLLAHSGAAFCLTPDHAVQHGVHVAASGSPIPWISMPEMVAGMLAERQCKTVGILGTRWVTKGSAYQTLLGMRGIQQLIPDDEATERIDRIVFDELVYGRVRGDSRDHIYRTIEDFKQRGCEGVVMASSEIPLLLREEESPLPLYNPAEILARAAVDRSLSDPSDDPPSMIG